MKFFLFFALTHLFVFSVHAEVLETKFKVTARYFDELGNGRKLVSTRVFVRFNPGANLLSENAKSDCLVIVGKSDILSLGTESFVGPCISNKNLVFTTTETIEEIFFRPTIFSFSDFHIENVQRLVSEKASLQSECSNDLGISGSIHSTIRNIMSWTVDAQVISLQGNTTYTLKGSGRAKYVIELEPLKTTAILQ